MSFKKHLLIRRSFEILSFYIAPVYTLNLFLSPYLVDSKQLPLDSKQPSSTTIFGDAPKRIIAPLKSTSILIKTPAVDQKEKTVSLVDIVREHCTSLFSPWEPTWWLNSGHLQTFWSSAGNFTDIDRIEYDRTLLELPDGGLIGVDFTSPLGEKISEDTPILIVLPGLTGGSQASYVRTLLSVTSASRSTGNLGMRGVVVNSRGCGNVPLRTPQISAGSPDDLRSALLFIRSRYPDAPLYAVGFSLGGTVLSKYLGEEGEKSEIRAGCVLACPWDLLKNSQLLESQFFHRHVYSRALAKSYLALLHRSLPSLEIPPSSHFHSHLEIIRTLRAPTFTTLNTHLTAVIGGSAPTFPHESVDAYYVWASCAKDISGIRVPLLAINADDDPIVRALPEDEVRSNESGSVVMVVTRGGGHLGWFSGAEGKRRWIGTPIVQWMRAMSESVVWPGGAVMPDRERVTDDVDGFTRAKHGRREIGFRVYLEGEMSSVSSSGGLGDTSVPGALAGL